MAIKVEFPSGKSTVTVEGLFQWDYGQVLEIECNEVGTEILEVHFACQNMSEAKVRVCSFANGVGSVTIPDECLEQASIITAWVYKVDSAHGHTIKTITLPIVARARPSKQRDVPTEYVDQYGQLIEKVNDAITALETGEVTVAKAESAATANHATTAGSAASATYATKAGSSDVYTGAAVISYSSGALPAGLEEGSSSKFYIKYLPDDMLIVPDAEFLIKFEAGYTPQSDADAPTLRMGADMDVLGFQCETLESNAQSAWWNANDILRLRLRYGSSGGSVNAWEILENCTQRRIYATAERGAPASVISASDTTLYFKNGIEEIVLDKNSVYVIQSGWNTYLLAIGDSSGVEWQSTTSVGDSFTSRFIYTTSGELKFQTLVSGGGFQTKTDYQGNGHIIKIATFN